MFRSVLRGQSGGKPYASDLSDERWALIEPVVTAWKAAHPSVSGPQGRYEMREIVNAILFQSRTGCQWSLLPHGLPPRSAVMYYYTAWRKDGTDKATTGRDAAKKVPGRTRGLAVDVLGLVIAVVVSGSFDPRQRHR
ncbi:transposase [Nonomuraea salmonea]|uniref:transposase n=1 Tax=Nonomuraea TaxID=83681 RepID=UPI003436C9E7